MARTRRQDPLPQPERRPETRRRSPAQAIIHAIHGFGFLIVAAVSMLWFGQIFSLVAAVIVAVCLMSLKEAWDEWREYRGR